MSPTYQLKSGVSLLELEKGTALISHFGRRVWIEADGLDQFFRQFLQRAEVSFTSEQMQEAMKSLLSKKDTEDLIRFLMGKHLLIVSSVPTVGAGAGTPHVLRSFLERFTSSAEILQAWTGTLQNTRVEVISDEQQLMDSLSFELFPIQRPRSSSEMTVDDFKTTEPVFYLLIGTLNRLEALLKVNRLCASTGARVLPVICDSTGAFVGPLIGPVGQPCLDCWWAHRQANMKSIEWRLQRHGKLADDEMQTTWPSHFWKNLSFHVENEILKHFLKHLKPHTMDSCLILDFFNSLSHAEVLHRRPGCTTCYTGIRGLS